MGQAGEGTLRHTSARTWPARPTVGASLARTLGRKTTSRIPPMFLLFPPHAAANVRVPYERPYEDPIALKAGDAVTIDAERTATTDILGWCWCTGPDGREGWVPDAWLVLCEGVHRINRDFSALELTIQRGERLTLQYSESGFVFVTKADGSSGWIPDACLELAAE